MGGPMMLRVLEFAAAVAIVIVAVTGAVYAMGFISSLAETDKKMRKDEGDMSRFANFTQAESPWLKRMETASYIVGFILAISATILIIIGIWSSDWRWMVTSVVVGLISWFAFIYGNTCAAAVRHLAREKEKSEGDFENYR